MNKYKLTYGQALAIYGVLIVLCNAPASGAQLFTLSLAEERYQHEYRFGGVFGFGGKFHYDRYGWRVSYYIEHKTDELDAMRDKTNAVLTILYERLIPSSEDLDI